MSETYTPGPWEWTPGDHSDHHPNPNVVTAWGYDAWGVIVHNEADARLMAAAPELLEAARAVLYDAAQGRGALGPALFDPLRAAIAKATGEER